MDVFNKNSLYCSSKENGHQHESNEDPRNVDHIFRLAGRQPCAKIDQQDHLPYKSQRGHDQKQTGADRGKTGRKTDNIVGKQRHHPGGDNRPFFSPVEKQIKMNEIFFLKEFEGQFFSIALGKSKHNCRTDGCPYQTIQ